MQDNSRAAAVLPLRQVLVDDAFGRSAWGYLAGKSPRIEPTAWALLALSVTTDRSTPEWTDISSAPLAFLLRCQQPSGLLVEDVALPPNLTANAIACCLFSALREREEIAAARTRLRDGLVSIKGISVDEPDPRQNNRLQGWPWLPDTFSWVEPTSWCTLALKQMRRQDPSADADARINEAELLLFNRSCEVGGWNYGNASAVGQDLRPYVPTTAAGVLALQDRRSDSVVTRAIDRLGVSRLSEPSGFALSLAALALRIAGRETDDVEERIAGDVSRLIRGGNIQAMAMACYTLSAPEHNAAALRV